MVEAAVVGAELVFGLATVLVLAQIAIPRVAAWRVLASSLWRTLGSWRRLAYLGTCLAVVASDCAYLASGLDRRCTAWVVARRGEDFTALIHRHVEGDAAAHVQATLAWLPLTYGLGFCYLVGFAALAPGAMLAFDHQRHRRVLAGLVLNYLLVFPFYVAFPVREAFVYYQQTPATGPASWLLLDDISPLLMRAYRTTSGVDNCFPSFHTSLSVTLALVAWHGGRRLGWPTTVLAALIAVSTIYLGVHWLTDVAAGLLTGLVAYALARAATRRWEVASG